MMGGLDWSAVPIVVELFGITDVEGFVLQLTEIRKWRHAQAAADEGA